MMKRGDVYWVDLGIKSVGSEINKLRPCVLMSVTSINQVRRTVLVVPLSTSAKPNSPIVTKITFSNKKNVVAVCDQIRSIDKTRIKNKMGQLSLEDVQCIEESLQKVLGLSH